MTAESESPPSRDGQADAVEIYAEETIPVRAGQEFDPDVVGAYVRARVPDLEPLVGVAQYPNGSANITYQLTFGDRRLVLRRPPAGELAPGAHDMRREYRALAKLYKSYDRAPRAYVFCDDHSVIGADFFVMEYREGVVVWDHIPQSLTHYERIGHRLGIAVVDAVADLHLVDPRSCDLEGLGRPDGFLQRQLDGWAKRWELVAPETPVPAMTEALRILRDRIPEPQRVAILHNDPKLNNCQFRVDDPDRVHSVFDWDMATLGDPLIDLGTLLNNWPSVAEDGMPVGIYTPGVETLGLPIRSQVIERYYQRTGFELSELVWYEALASLRTVVALRQLYMRYVRGETSDARMATRGDRILPLAERTLWMLQRLA
jgi:aminoglycoside phosphotransferase (APT) family kinase protein